MPCIAAECSALQRSTRAATGACSPGAVSTVLKVSKERNTYNPRRSAVQRIAGVSQAGRSIVKPGTSGRERPGPRFQHTSSRAHARSVVWLTGKISAAGMLFARVLAALVALHLRHCLALNLPGGGHDLPGWNGEALFDDASPELRLGKVSPVPERSFAHPSADAAPRGALPTAPSNTNIR